MAIFAKLLLSIKKLMDSDMTKHRVLWLLNHTTLRNFEVSQLRALGIVEVYTPKSFPFDEGNLSADVDFSLDASLSIPKDELDVLNAQDWYEAPSAEAWEIANRYFAVAVVGFFPEQLKSAVRNFKGAVILRVFGLSAGNSYSQLIYRFAGERLVRDVKELGRRFWFGAGYDHLHQIESHFLSSRNCFLPVGLSVNDTSAEWSGCNGRVFFVCPRIGSSPYFEKVYKDFLLNFGELPYTIGGAQPVDVGDPNVIGFVCRAEHERNMREHRVMFYHSQEPNHIHYHPFEAIAAGMPLVFMGGGLLDRLGGTRLPGRCTSIDEAKEKVRRVLEGDDELIRSIRTTQCVLLEAIRAENCAAIWQSGMLRVLQELECSEPSPATRPKRRAKVAVVLPVAYRGGSLRGAKLIAEAIRHGSGQAGEVVDVVFAHLGESDYSEGDFSDLHPAIKRRTFNWSYLTAAEARRAMRYSGHDGWEPAADRYSIVEDGIQQLLDCDLWLVVSDRITAPVLPLRPVVLMVYDYLQRYVHFLDHGADQGFLEAARAAERVFVTTEFTYQDVLQYGGVKQDKVVKLPMLSPSFSADLLGASPDESDYFIWTTNAALHKNHLKALQALRIYYEQFQGYLNVKITGVGTDKLLMGAPLHLKDMRAVLKGNNALTERLTWSGNLSDMEYRRLLSGATFLWHPASIDNGTFSVIEAASLGVPSLSSDYPAMREIDRQYMLGLAWMDASDALAMARALKEMELTYQARRELLPAATTLASQDVHQLSGEYWKAVRECL
ncbi:glycosytransferase [Stutzerimonas stutzeri]|uniref:glycosytransferase n=1 Tax=Stutzerimonas stutzeri TaxID=316 RepID=UPI0021B460E4|nr:glycosytransferase [Stutzerimonas stutzeri]